MPAREDTSEPDDQSIVVENRSSMSYAKIGLLAVSESCLCGCNVRGLYMEVFIRFGSGKMLGSCHT